MNRPDDKSLRFYIDLDMETLRLVHWGCGRKEHVNPAPPVATQQRVIISAEQYDRLQRRIGGGQLPLPTGAFNIADLMH